jgi:hypothetical protein
MQPQIIRRSVISGVAAQDAKPQLAAAARTAASTFELSPVA